MRMKRKRTLLINYRDILQFDITMQLISMWFFALDQIYAYNFSPHVKVRKHRHPHLNKHNLKKFV